MQSQFMFFKSSKSQPPILPQPWVCAHVRADLSLCYTKPCQVLPKVGQVLVIRIAVLSS